MVEKKLIDYAKRELKAGYSEEAVKQSIINAGYSGLDAAKAISMATTPEGVIKLREKEEWVYQAGGLERFSDRIKKDKKTQLSLALLAATLFAIIAFVGIGSGIGTKDCGEDVECLDNAIHECLRARGTRTLQNENLSITVDYKISSRILSSCRITATVRELQNIYIDSFRGNSMACTVPFNRLKYMSADIYLIKWNADTCFGGLSDEMDRLVEVR